MIMAFFSTDPNVDLNNDFDLEIGLTLSLNLKIDSIFVSNFDMGI